MTLRERLNHAGDTLARLAEKPPAGIAVLVVFAALFAGIAATLGTSLFSSDSWAYTELSKTVFSGDFYRINTLRSYFSADYSAAFPPGQPVAIALLRAAGGPELLSAVIVNITAALATGVLLLKLCRHVGISALGGIAVVCSLLLNRYYFDEMLSGRAIPTATFFFTAAVYAHVRSHHWLAGLLLGIAAEFRFDFLVFGIVYLAAAPWFLRRGAVAWLLLASGFVAGLLPWVLYSLTHFHALWVSDNSWVAMSVAPAYVLDYPAQAAATASDDPLGWLARLVGGLPVFFEVLFKAITRFPLALVMLVLVVLRWRELGAAPRHGAVLLFAAFAVATAPYVLTGYFSHRYFTPILVLATVFMLHAAATVPARNGRLQDNGAILLALLLALLPAAYYMGKNIHEGLAWPAQERALNEQFVKLAACAAQQPRITFVFGEDAWKNGAHFGAVSGLRTALLPSNFAVMSAAQRAAYFAHLQPYVLVENLTELPPCP